MLRIKKLFVCSMLLSSFFMIPGGMNAQTNPGEEEGGCSVECENITISCNEDEDCEEGDDYVVCSGYRYTCPS